MVVTDENWGVWRQVPAEHVGSSVPVPAEWAENGEMEMDAPVREGICPMSFDIVVSDVIHCHGVAVIVKCQ